MWFFSSYLGVCPASDHYFILTQLLSSEGHVPGIGSNVNEIWNHPILQMDATASVLKKLIVIHLKLLGRLTQNALCNPMKITASLLSLLLSSTAQLVGASEKC